MYGRPPKPRGEMPDTPQAFSQSNGVGQAGANKLLAKYNCFFFKNFMIMFLKKSFSPEKKKNLRSSCSLISFSSMNRVFPFNYKKDQKL